jgi:type IV secretion system protein VirD4
VDFVRPEKVKAAAPVEPEPKLAAEIVVRMEHVPEVTPSASDAEGPLTKAEPEGAAEPEVHLDMLKPPITISVSRMNRFTQKVSDLQV